jgi:hypothetical protein
LGGLTPNSLLDIPLVSQLSDNFKTWFGCINTAIGDKKKSTFTHKIFKLKIPYAIFKDNKVCIFFLLSFTSVHGLVVVFC